MTLISVLLPVYNSEDYVGGAITSILNQSWNEFELIIINDGSSDGSREVILSFSDPRIVFLDNSQNQGLVTSLNHGLSISRGDLIARMDADDISFPERFERQVSYLLENPSIGVVGTAFREIYSNGTSGPIHRNPPTHSLIAWSLCFRNPVAHPTVMMRKSVINEVGGYPADMIIPEDYHLWQILISRTEFSNLGDVLLKYRLHEKSVSTRLRAENRKNRITISHQAIENYLKRTVPLDTVKYFWTKDAIKEQDLEPAIDLIDQILRRGVEAPDLTQPERAFMQQYAARKILAFLNQCAPDQRMEVVRRASKMDPLVLPRMLYKRVFQTGM